MNETTRAENLLEVRELTFYRQSRAILDGISFRLEAGQVLALLGINGAGKSTLLRLVLGLLTPAAGEIRLAGRPLPEWSRRQIARQLAYVPQAHVSLFPYLVRDVVTMGRLPLGSLFRAPAPADRNAALAALHHMGISHLAARPYTEISGGERQLALIARALCQGARFLILDEPATGLDYGHQLRLLERLGQLANEGYGVLMSTHHPDHARLASTRVLLMDKGRIYAEGRPDSVLTPENLQFLYNIPPALLNRALSYGQGIDPGFSIA
ncbi:MAG: ABC transporter ATP-binding protein [Zoogloeaceae bacterium]|jgi:iron complex transport system ATP-binding protein|nr:ABC transporter ATP-binding protein [Zoogloeaceae bacterium]